MRPGPTILHADLDAFYASVEQRDDPRLLGRPVIVGAGVVLAASYEAKSRGVRTAMGGAQARRLCPQAVVVGPRMSAYAEASKAVFKIFEQTAPLVEGLSIDEAFLDVRGLKRISGTAPEIAARLRREIREGVGLPITVGVARTKFLAKVASGVAKPDGLLVVPPDGELAFLHPLPVKRLWGVGPVTAKKLRERGITTVGEVAQRAEAALVPMLGRAAGGHLHALAHNRDPRSLRVGRRRRSIGAQRALGRSPRSWEALEADLVALVDRLARRLRAARRVCRTVVLRLRFDDFSRASRSHTLSEATHLQNRQGGAALRLDGSIPSPLHGEKFLQGGDFRRWTPVGPLLWSLGEIRRNRAVRRLLTIAWRPVLGRPFGSVGRSTPPGLRARTRERSASRERAARSRALPARR